MHVRGFPLSNLGMRRLLFPTRRKGKFKSLFFITILILVTLYFYLNFMKFRYPSLQPDFRLVLPHVEPKLSAHEKHLYIVVVVNSLGNAEHRELRKAIRKTWGNWSNPWKISEHVSHGTYKWRLFFSLGIADNQADHNANQQEACEFNDVLIGNFSDIYINVVIKTFMSHYWAITRLSCEYVLKTDDDVYVRVPSLINWLVDSGTPKSFYGGVISLFTKVPRQRGYKWYISMEQYNGTTWPPWCHGAYHVLSSDVIPKYLKYTSIRRPFHSDDTYIGVASKDLGIKAVQIPGFTIENHHPERVRSETELMKSIAMGHKLQSWKMINYHDFYDSHGVT